MARAKTGSNRRLRSDFNIGGGAAESDRLLQEAFYETGLYRSISSRDDRRCFLVGRTGSGKSAALQRLADQLPAHVIRINPDDLSLPYITDLGVVRYLASLEVRLDPLFNALWKHVLLVEIIKHRYGVYSQDAQQRFIALIMDKIKRNRSKQAALAYLEQFEGKFWCETDQRVKEISRTFESQVNAEAGGKISVGIGELSVGGGGNQAASSTERTELVNRFQRIVNDTQLPRLNQMMNVLDEDILDSPQNFTYILIDDLDRDWADEQIANMLIRCLFQVVVSLQRVRNLKILVALRTNIFEALDFGRTGGQEEKFRDLTLRVHWTKGDLIELLDQRVVVAAQHHSVPDVSQFTDLLPGVNKTRGSALDFILDRTLMRPRDAIAFVNQCLNLATGKDRLTWKEIHAAETAYSNDRLLALRDEWKPTFPGIDRVLHTFRGCPAFVDPVELTIILDDCILLAAGRDFEGTNWMTRLGAPVWEGYGLHDWAEMYQPLIRMLYNIGFLGCVRRRNEPSVYSHDEPDYPDRVSNIRDAAGFVIHPAFRPALDISD